MASSILTRKTPITTREEFIALAKQYHPDLIKDGGAAMAHINVLYAKDYVPPNQVRVGSLVYNYTSQYQNTYIGINSVLFIHNLPPNTVPVFKFPDSRAQEEMSKYLPVYLRSEETYSVIGKPKILFSLREYLSHITQTPHSSWVISSLYNLLCYLEWARITHNAITIDNVFFDPKLHSAHLLGGWEFSKSLNSPLTHLPKAAFEARPREAKLKVSTHLFDLTLIKRLGLELMGDRTGMSLDSNIAKVRCLRAPSSGSALIDYRAWIASLGTRKFVELKL